MIVDGMIYIKFSYDYETAFNNGSEAISRVENFYSDRVSKIIQGYYHSSVKANYHTVEKAIEVRIKVYTTKDRFEKLCDRVGQTVDLEIGGSRVLHRVSLNRQFYGADGSSELMQERSGVSIDDAINKVLDGYNTNLDEIELPPMTNRQFWIKLFSENDVALIAAISSLQRNTPSEYKPLNDSEMEFIMKQKQLLNEKADDSIVEEVFGKLASSVKDTYDFRDNELIFNCCNKQMIISHDSSYDYTGLVSCPFCGRKIRYWKSKT